MNRPLILIFLASCIAIATCGYKPNRCFKCKYVKEKTYTEEYKVPVKVPNKDCKGYKCEDKIIYETRTRKVTRKAIGAEVCLGPLYELTAESEGAYIVDCSEKCFVKEDYEGNVQRGCTDRQKYLNVDPTDPRCQKDGDNTYCFCGNDLCNYDVV